MEILKKLKAAIVIAIIFSSNLIAQDLDKMITGFATSYDYEYAAKYADAIKEIEKVYSDKSYECNVRLGWLNYMNAKSAVAITYYQKAIALMPYAIEARLGIVYPLSAMENWNEVIKQYQEVLKIAPENTKANYNLGYIYFNREQYSEAKKYFDKYMNLFPMEYDGVLMSAWTYFKLGKTAEAKLLFKKVMILSPNNASAKEGLGLIK